MPFSKSNFLKNNVIASLTFVIGYLPTTHSFDDLISRSSFAAVVLPQSVEKKTEVANCVARILKSGAKECVLWRLRSLLVN